jgi:hypothetical protein
MPFGTAPAPAAGPGASQAALAQLAPNPFAGTSPTTELDFPEPKKKGPLVIGIVVLVLAAAGAAIALGTSKPKAPAPPPVPTVTATAPTAEATAPTSTSTSTPTPTATETQTGGELPSGPTAPPSANGDFSKLFAAGAEKAQKSDAPGSAKAFDPEEARAAVAGVLKAVAACKEPGGPTGQTSAAVTFGANGLVTGVTVGAPFSGTSTGTCIIGAFKGAKVAPFSGLPGTVSQPVSLL